MKVMHERVAGIDVHKKMIKVAVRSPGARPWTRKTEILTFSTYYGVLREMARDLRARGVTHVVMEAAASTPSRCTTRWQKRTSPRSWWSTPRTSRRSRATDQRHGVPARLAELLECGLLQGSYIPPPELKEVRDLTRLRTKKVQARTSDVQRLGKNAGISRHQARLSRLRYYRQGAHRDDRGAHRRGTARRGHGGPGHRPGPFCDKTADLSMALEGRFTGHHAMMCRLHLDAIQRCTMRRSRTWTRGSPPGPRPGSGRRACSRRSPGSATRSHWTWIAEIGPAPHEWFASDARLASWATALRRATTSSAGKRGYGRTGGAGTWIKPVLVQAAWAAVRAPGRLPGPLPPPWSAAWAARRSPPRRRRPSSRSRTPCSRSPTPRPAGRDPLTRSPAPTSTPAASSPPTAMPGWKSSSRSLHPGCTVTVTVTPPAEAPPPPGHVPEAILTPPALSRRLRRRLLPRARTGPRFRVSRLDHADVDRAAGRGADSSRRSSRSPRCWPGSSRCYPNCYRPRR